MIWKIHLHVGFLQIRSQIIVLLQYTIYNMHLLVKFSNKTLTCILFDICSVYWYLGPVYVVYTQLLTNSNAFLCTMRYLHKYFTMLAGAVAGLSMMLWKSPSTAIYGAVKAIEVSVTGWLNIWLRQLTDWLTDWLTDGGTDWWIDTPTYRHNSYYFLLQIIYWRMVGVGWLPIIRHADVPMYALATAITLHLVSSV